MPRDDRFITASEIGTWCYCRKAWQLRQRGCPSSLTEERAAGVRYQQSHNRDIRIACRQYAGARFVLVVCVLGLVLIGVLHLALK